MSTRRGIPGVRGMEHIGVTVPDIDQAHRFFVEILGCEPIYELGEKRADDDWMAAHLGVHPRTRIERIRFYRLGYGTNLEVFLYVPADDQRPVARNSDLGGFHLALYVDDIDAAVAYLRAHDVEVMGEAPTASAADAAGQRWIYFRSPWGLQFELVSFPEGKAYEHEAKRLLWHPARPQS